MAYSDADVEAMIGEVVAEVGEMDGEIARVLRTTPRDRVREIADTLLWLQRNIWSKIPPEHLGRGPTQEEMEELWDTFGEYDTPGCADAPESDGGPLAPVRNHGAER